MDGTLVAGISGASRQGIFTLLESGREGDCFSALVSTRGHAEGQQEEAWGGLNTILPIVESSKRETLSVDGDREW